MIQHAMILHTRKNEESGTQTRLWTQKTLYIMLLVGDLRGIGCEYLWQIDHVIPRLHCSLIFTGSGNGLLPVRQQATTWTNDDLLLCFASEEFRAWIWLIFSGTTKHYANPVLQNYALATNSSGSLPATWRARNLQVSWNKNKDLVYTLSCWICFFKHFLYLLKPEIVKVVEIIPCSNADKSDFKHQNTLGCLDQYRCRGLRLWNS